MKQTEAFVKELKNEGVTTRKMLSIVPDDKFDWQPHPKSMTIKRLAAHIAELPGWVGMALNTTELDFQNNPYKPKDFNTTKEILADFESNLSDAIEQLENVNEDLLSETWILRNGDQILSTGSKADIIRISLSQIIHHRAQLGVFLRLLDIPIPGSYGPSADETF